MTVRIATAGARKRFASLVKQAARGERVKITRYNKTAVVMIPKHDLEALEECEKKSAAAKPVARKVDRRRCGSSARWSPVDRYSPLGAARVSCSGLRPSLLDGEVVGDAGRRQVVRALEFAQSLAGRPVQLAGFVRLRQPAMRGQLLLERLDGLRFQEARR